MASNPGEKIKSLSVRVAKAKREGIKLAVKYLLKIIPELIRTRTEEGIDSTGKPFDDLAFSTTMFRELYRRNLDSRTTPQQANNIATGQLIDSIIGKFNGDSVVFTLKDKRKKELSGRASTSTNNKVAEGLRKMGRPFFDITQEERSDLEKEVAKIIQDEITRAIK